MQAIYNLEEEIQSTRILFASLKIQLAFNTIINLFNHKSQILQSHFFVKLKLYDCHSILAQVSKPLKQLERFLNKKIHNTKMQSFLMIQMISETRQLEHSVGEYSQLFEQSSVRELEKQCQFMKKQIEHLEKSFQLFVENINKKKWKPNRYYPD